MRNFENSKFRKVEMQPHFEFSERERVSYFQLKALFGQSVSQSQITGIIMFICYNFVNFELHYSSKLTKEFNDHEINKNIKYTVIIVQNNFIEQRWSVKIMLINYRIGYSR